MPASPRDFLLYSRMTGKPMPENAMERMRMAPEVYQFTKNFAKQPNLLEKTGNLARSIGRGAVMAIGAPMVAEAVAAEADRKEKVDVTGDVQPEIPTALQVEQEKTRREEIKIQGKKDLQRMANTGVQQTNLNPVQMDDYQSLLNPTTADSYGQDYVPNQTASNIVDRKITQGSQIADSTPNVAEVLSETQDSQPPEEMVGGEGKNQLAKFVF